MAHSLSTLGGMQSGPGALPGLPLPRSCQAPSSVKGGCVGL